MNSKKGWILLLVICIFSGLRLSKAQQQPNCLAVITEIKGEALLKKLNKSEFSKATWGTQLFQGDEIKTADKSELKILFSNSNLISLGPNSMIKIAGKESASTETTGNVRNISSAALVDLSAFSFNKVDKKDVGALAGLRSVATDQSIELTSPYNTLIKTDRPTFSWIPKKSYDNYFVNLYNSKGLVWKKKVSENSMKYPENEKALDFGETYFWNVEGEYLIDTDKSANHKFSVLSADKSKEVEENEKMIRDTFKNDPESSSLHSILGAFYINKGLLQDAISEFLNISKINTDTALPHEILGSLYSEIGDKDKAIDELQKALTLTKGKDR
jgi:tetratricopeptide (TPR) repeat protein